MGRDSLINRQELIKSELYKLNTSLAQQYLANVLEGSNVDPVKTEKYKHDDARRSELVEELSKIKKMLTEN